MSQLGVDFAAMQDAANAALQAADGAKGHGASQTVLGAGAAMPGSQSSDHLDQLGQSWDDEVAEWVSDTHDFGTDLAEAGEDYRSVDQGAGRLFGGLLGGG